MFISQMNRYKQEHVRGLIQNICLLNRNVSYSKEIKCGAVGGAIGGAVAGPIIDAERKNVPLGILAGDIEAMQCVEVGDNGNIQVADVL